MFIRWTSVGATTNLSRADFHHSLCILKKFVCNMNFPGTPVLIGFPFSCWLSIFTFYFLLFTTFLRQNAPFWSILIVFSQSFSKSFLLLTEVQLDILETSDPLTNINNQKFLDSALVTKWIEQRITAQISCVITFFFTMHLWGSILAEGLA